MNRWLVALSRDATLNQVGFDARRVDGENWVIRASAPNDSRAALFKERVRLLTGTKWCWDSYENMSFKDMVNTDQVSVASGIYAELEPLFALLDAHGKIPVVASAFDLHGGVVVLCGKLPPPVAAMVKSFDPRMVRFDALRSWNRHRGMDLAASVTPAMSRPILSSVISQMRSITVRTVQSCVALRAQRRVPTALRA